eukprot:m51a1_g3743 putative atp-dependent rna helicase tdrd9-like (949) ;mRNA; r:56089-60899
MADPDHLSASRPRKYELLLSCVHGAACEDMPPLRLCEGCHLVPALLDPGSPPPGECLPARWVRGATLTRAFEGTQLEFKQCRRDLLSRLPDDIERYANAFVNTRGGLLVYGVTDKGVVDGTFRLCFFPLQPRERKPQQHAPTIRMEVVYKRPAEQRRDDDERPSVIVFAMAYHKTASSMYVSFRNDISFAVQRFNSSTQFVPCRLVSSGKSTQVPQIILESYKDDESAPVTVLVAQPRRIAAVSLAKRVAAEMGVKLGTKVGFHIGRTSVYDDSTRVLFVTTGMLKVYISNNTNLLRKFTHIVVDEIHERQIDTDLCLSMLRTYVQQRPRLRLVLMSATIDVSIFAEYCGRFPMLINADMGVHCDQIQEGVVQYTGSPHMAPVVELKGRQFPITEYFIDDVLSPEDMKTVRSEYDSDKPRLISLVEKAAERVTADLSITYRSLLVFLPGISTILSVQDQLTKGPLYGRMEVVTLHSTCSIEEQRRSLEPPAPGKLKVVLCTNIAESSITVPDVVVVIDSCLCRQMTWDRRTRLHSLKDEWISKEVAEWRTGERADVTIARCVDPPAIADIRVAMQNLVDYGALETRLAEDGSVATVALSPLGEFLVRMPVPYQTGVNALCSWARERERFNDDRDLFKLAGDEDHWISTFAMREAEDTVYQLRVCLSECGLCRLPRKSETAHRAMYTRDLINSTFDDAFKEFECSGDSDDYVDFSDAGLFGDMDDSLFPVSEEQLIPQDPPSEKEESGHAANWANVWREMDINVETGADHVLRIRDLPGSQIDAFKQLVPSCEFLFQAASSQVELDRLSLAYPAPFFKANGRPRYAIASAIFTTTNSKSRIKHSAKALSVFPDDALSLPDVIPLVFIRNSKFREGLLTARTAGCEVIRYVNASEDDIDQECGFRNGDDARRALLKLVRSRTLTQVATSLRDKNSGSEYSQYPYLDISDH